MELPAKGLTAAREAAHCPPPLRLRESQWYRENLGVETGHQITIIKPGLEEDLDLGILAWYL